MSKITLVCERCGKDFQISPAGAKGRRFCSWKCHTTKVERTCLNCGKVIYVHHCSIDKGLGKYCSSECYNEYRTGRHRKQVTLFRCQTCSKVFGVNPYRANNSDVKYCSHDCQTEAQTTRIERSCLVCGQKFEAHLSNLKRGHGKYCSVECSGKARSLFLEPNCTCEACGKEFHLKPSAIKRGRGRYCSFECRKQQVKLVCPCGNRFTTTLYRLENCGAKYCSRSCFRKYSKANRVHCICKNCGTEFELYESELKSRPGYYCSRECAVKGSAPTYIERLCYRRFEDLGFIEGQDFLFQYGYPKSRYVLDFYFPADKIVVEANGVYWHTLPGARRRDRKRRKYLESKGLRVLEWWGSDIKTNLPTLIKNELFPCLTSYPNYAILAT